MSALRPAFLWALLVVAAVAGGVYLTDQLFIAPSRALPRQLAERDAPIKAPTQPNPALEAPRQPLRHTERPARGARSDDRPRGTPAHARQIHRARRPGRSDRRTP